MLYVPLKGKSRGAFRGQLQCPHCGAGKFGKPKARWRYVERTTPFRIRYQCKNCKRHVLYDFSNNSEFMRKHPYSSFKKKRFQDIVAMSKYKPVR